MTERRRALERIAGSVPLTADTPDGAVVQLRGVVVQLDMYLRGPTTGRACVAYGVRVHDPARDIVDFVPFAVDCAIGRIHIAGDAAELVLPDQRVEHVHAASWAAFRSERALPQTATGVERIVVAGDRVHVRGVRRGRALVSEVGEPLLVVDD